MSFGNFASLWVSGLKKVAPHLLVYIVFCLVLSISFPQELQVSKKSLVQNDVEFYKNSTWEVDKYRAKGGEVIGWTNTMFSGMPVFPAMGSGLTNTSEFKMDVVGLFGTSRLANLFGLRYLFMNVSSWSVLSILFKLMIGCYVLMLVLRVRWYIALPASIAFGLSTGYLLALEAGHNAKIYNFGYMPLLLAGAILIFRRRYFFGAFLSFMSLGESILAFHPQITYYSCLVILVYLIVKGLDAYKQSQGRSYLLSLGVLSLCYGLALGVGMVKVWPVLEYNKHSIRGGSELVLEKGENEKSRGLSKEYITNWSLGKMETLTLVIPHFMGGGVEKLDEESNLYRKVSNMGASVSEAKRFINRVPTYWGDQPFVSGPPYMGATVFFMVCFSLFLIKGFYRKFFVAVIVMGLVFAWGKNIMWFTDLLIDYFPYYNKFRTVSMAVGISVFACCVFGFLGLNKFLDRETGDPETSQSLWRSFYVSAGLMLLVLLSGSFFDMRAQGDDWFEKPGLLDALKQDRLAMLRSSALRSLLFVALTFGVCWVYFKRKVSKYGFAFGLILLIVLDLQLINNNYFGAENYNATSKKNIQQPTVADIDIQKDTTIYRVYNTTRSPMSDGVTPRYHFSIGGYSGVKMSRYQDLFDHQIGQGNMGVINMLNAKYFIIRDKETGQPVAVQNPTALGNAWFISGVHSVTGAREEMQKLSEIDTRSEVVVDHSLFDVGEMDRFDIDTTASVNLVAYHPDTMIYHTESAKKSLVVFSEIYYPSWQAYLDGVPVDHFRCNYVLRGMIVPEGVHDVKFIYRATAERFGVYVSNIFSRISLGLLFFFSVFVGFTEFRKRRRSTISPALKSE